MGIDIYLDGAEEYQSRIAEERGRFERAVAYRNSIPSDQPELQEKAQKEVEICWGALYSGKKGYLCSSYNRSGLFRGLEEIFGFDVAAYIFPGDWRNLVPVKENFIQRPGFHFR